MTSENSSSTKTFKKTSLQLELTRQRLWQLVVIAIINFVNYVGATYTILIGCKENVGLFDDDPSFEKRAVYQLTEYVFSPNGMMGFVCACIAICCAVLGYSWLNNRQQLDFYEALPIKKGVRWRAVFINGILLMLIPQIIFMCLGILLALSFGCEAPALLTSALNGLLWTGVMEVSVYSVSVLVAMLCGNIVIAFLGTAVFAFIEVNFKFVIAAFEQFSFVTSYESVAKVSPRYFLSPFANYATSLFVRNLDLKELILNIVIFFAAAVIAFALYRVRKNEMAGSSIVFPAARDIISIVLNIEFTINILMLFSGLFSDKNSFGTTLFLIVVTLVTSFIGGISLNMILYMNVRALLKKPVIILISTAVSVFILLTFRYDIFGYDRYLPAPNKVESCALYMNNNMGYYVGEDGSLGYSDIDDYALKYMKLKNIEDVEKLVKLGEDTLRANKYSENYIPVYDMTVLFRLKNGKNVYRHLEIPKDVDAEIMDAVFSTKEFREGYFPIYHAELFEKNFKDEPSISFSAYGKNRMAYGEDVAEEFKEAYEKDLENYSYSNVMKSNVIGSVCYERKNIFEDHEASRDMTFTIYDSFTNTIEFLKKHYIFIDLKMDISNIKEIVVVDESRDDDKSVTYTDREKIEKIVETIHDSAVSATWVDDASDYDVEIVFKDGTPEDESLNENSYFNAAFTENEIPDFVKKDLAE